MIITINDQITEITERLPEQTIKMLEALEKHSPSAASLLLKKYARMENALKSGNLAALKKIKTEDKENFKDFFRELKKAADIAEIKERIYKLQ